jgi:hypothetical protein
MLHKETLHRSPGKRIELFIYKDSRGHLIMGLQEYDVEPPTADGIVFEKFMLFNSWSPRVAVESCKRATAAAVQRFYNAHAPEARKLAEARAAYLTEAN